MSSLMAVASASLVIPATLYGALDKSKGRKDDEILTLSHGTSIILLVLYVMYLYFQLYSHAKLFEGDSEEGGNSQGGHDVESGNAAQSNGVEANGVNGENHDNSHDAQGAGQDGRASHVRHEGDTLSPWAAGIALVMITVVVAVCAEYLVDSIDAIVETAHISKTFIGLILIPIVGNAAEHVTAVIVAGKGKMDLAIGVALGSSLQIALLVTPFLVILGWIIDQPMTLHFEVFETVVFFLSTIVVNYLIQDGVSNYLEGAMLLGT